MTDWSGGVEVCPRGRRLHPIAHNPLGAHDPYPSNLAHCRRSRPARSALLLGACGNDSDDAAQKTEQNNTAPAPGAGSESIASREATKDVKVTECKVDNGQASVKATITNSGDAAATYIIPVTVKQGDKAVDTLALLANGVEPGKEGTAEQKGNASNLEGDITCEVGEVTAAS